VFSFHPRYRRQPFDAPSIYAMIHISNAMGHPLRAGRDGRARRALGKLFDELGGKVHFNSEIEEILVDERRKDRVSGFASRTARSTTPISHLECRCRLHLRNLIPENYRRKYTNKRVST